MRLLFSSPDLKEVVHHVKRLVWARIPCAVSKDPVTYCLSVWIQQDVDYIGALDLFVHRAAPRPVAHWASALDPTPSPDWKSASVLRKATNTGSFRANASETETCWDLAERPVPVEAQLSYFELEHGPRRRGSRLCLCGK
jgi:hypothetical protein